MTDKEKLDIVSRAFEDTIWMAIRYANGRLSYSPSMVRGSVKMYQSVYPNWKPKFDSTIQFDYDNEYRGAHQGDCLADILAEDKP
jgi:hypothetical protein